jgi:hypothetical protein
LSSTSGAAATAAEEREEEAVGEEAAGSPKNFFPAYLSRIKASRSLEIRKLNPYKSPTILKHAR